MTLLIVLPDRIQDAHNLATALRTINGDIDVRVWPDIGEAEAVEMVVAWHHRHGCLASFSNLRLVASFGAGVEHLLQDSGLATHVPIVRTVDPALVRGMAEYVVLAITDWRRGWSRYKDDQKRGSWRPQPYAFSSTVLLMGVGRMGSAVAEALVALGYRVIVWSRSGVTIEGAECVAGRKGLEEALPQADAVVCLLPLTSQTENILNCGLFSIMKPGTLLVNVGRGNHLVEPDLIDGLAVGKPGHAVLDVFREEPLPPEHSFWNHPNITLTPHIAALTDPMGAAECIAENWRRLQSGEALMDPVDRTQGY